MSKWEWKKLGEVYDFTRGLTYSKKDEVESSSNCILRSNNIDLQTNLINLDELKYIKDEIEIPQEKYVRKNTILICMSNGSKAHLGKVAYIDKDYDFAFGGFMGLLKPKCEINGKFVHLYLCSDEYKNFIKSLSDGANINNLKFDDLRKFEIPFPPLSEQNRIVKFLDNEFSKIDTLKTNAETNLKNAKELFYAELKKTFHEKGSWKTVQLGEIALEYGRGKSKHRPRNDECLFGGEYPFIQTGDIRNSGKYVVDYTETYNEIGLAQSKLWQKGTLCITIAANIAETAILTFPCCFPDSVIGFVPNEQYSSVDFIYYVILYFRTELQKISKGAAQDNLNLAKLESMNFPLPPLSVQKEIVARLDKLSENVNRLEANYKQIIANCDELKKSILKKTFEGDSRSSRE